MSKNIYLQTIKQISAQEPLSDNWFLAPIFPKEPFVRCIEPNYKQHFAPNEARRLGTILKRAMLVSRKVLEESAISSPDAIITGTGLGCIENTEIFLNDLVSNGEQFLKPTNFMQSTHNTIGSLIAIDTKCRGYNTTYAAKGISFESAILDAQMQIQNDRIRNALVGAYDEMTPDYFTLLKKVGYLGREGSVFAGETAVGMMLCDKENDSSLCKIEKIEIIHGAVPSNLVKKLQEYGYIDAIICNVNGNKENDTPVYEFQKTAFPKTPLLYYKHLFGESYTASAFGVYVAALCLKHQNIPSYLFVENTIALKNNLSRPVKRILCINFTENHNSSFILLSVCGKS